MTKKISVCIPAYNRARFLVPLLDSIRAQTVQPDEVVICEDVSPERDAISQIVKDYQIMYPAFPLKLFLNEVNLGYDKNFKMLLNSSTGDYCFFMGNDDLMVPEAIEKVTKAVESHPNVAVLSRAYQWFLNDESNIQDTVRHLSEDELFEPGVEAVRFFYRRMGVLSGLVIDRNKAVAIETDEFDGHLYYQMYLAGKLLQSNQGYYIASVQTLSRDGINPDFAQKNAYTNFGRISGLLSYKGLIRLRALNILTKRSFEVNKVYFRKSFSNVWLYIFTFFVVRLPRNFVLMFVGTRFKNKYQNLIS